MLFALKEKEASCEAEGPGSALSNDGPNCASVFSLKLPGTCLLLSGLPSQTPRVVRAPPSCRAVHKLFLVNSPLLCLYAGANGDFTVLRACRASHPSRRRNSPGHPARTGEPWTPGLSGSEQSDCRESALLGRRCVTGLRSQAAANVNVGVDMEKVEFSTPRPQVCLPLKLTHIR